MSLTYLPKVLCLPTHTHGPGLTPPHINSESGLTPPPPPSSWGRTTALRLAGIDLSRRRQQTKSHLKINAKKNFISRDILCIFDIVLCNFTKKFHCFLKKIGSFMWFHVKKTSLIGKIGSISSYRAWLFLNNGSSNIVPSQWQRASLHNSSSPLPLRYNLHINKWFRLGKKKHGRNKKVKNIFSFISASFVNHAKMK